MIINQISVFNMILFLNIALFFYIIIWNKGKFIQKFSVGPLLFFIVLIGLRGIYQGYYVRGIMFQTNWFLNSLFTILYLPIYEGIVEIKISNLLWAVWTLGSIYSFIANCYSYGKLEKYIGKIRKYEDPTAYKIADEIRKDESIRRKPKIYRSPDISEPFLMGIRHGRIFIPDIPFTEEELKFILHHELQHFKHYDNFKRCLLLIFRNIFWWNPLMERYFNDCEHVMEIHCDLRTVKNMNKEERIHYGETILKVVKECNTLNSSYETVHCTGFFRRQAKEKLKQRLQVIADFQEKKVRKAPRISLYILGILLFLGSYMVNFTPSFDPTLDDIDGEYDYWISDNTESFILDYESENEYQIYINNVFYEAISKDHELPKKYEDLPVYEAEE